MGETPNSTRKIIDYNAADSIIKGNLSINITVADITGLTLAKGLPNNLLENKDNLKSDFLL
jgi:hypothetical protein